MKKTKVAKLKLNRETVRNLEDHQLGPVAGAFVKDDTGNCGSYTDCTGLGCNTYRCSFYCP